MSDERRPEEHEELDEQVEDLDVPESDTEEVKGGRPTHCATGKHIGEATLG